MVVNTTQAACVVSALTEPTPECSQSQPRSIPTVCRSPQRARCQATPLRSVREMCLLLTAPYIEPALAAIMLRRADSSTQSSAPVLWQRRSSFHHIELLLTQAVGPLRAN